MFSKLHDQYYSMTAEEKAAIDVKTAAALNRYNARWNDHDANTAFIAATTGRNADYGNELLDEALAYCGHPHYMVSKRHWNAKAQEFLDLFIEDTTQWTIEYKPIQPGTSIEVLKNGEWAWLLVKDIRIRFGGRAHTEVLVYTESAEFDTPVFWVDLEDLTIFCIR